MDLPSHGSAVGRILAGLDTFPGARAELPRELTRACATSLGMSGAGIALMVDSTPAGVVAASDQRAQDLEALQFVLGEGPCTEAARRARPVFVPNLARDSARWPVFADGALQLGVHAVFAFPLMVDGGCLGVLDLYLDHPRPLSPAENTLALNYVDAATAVLLHLQEHAEPGADGIATVAVLDDRSVVHRAAGAVAVQAGVDVTAALLLLRARAFADEAPVLQLARAVLADEVRFPTEHT